MTGAELDMALDYARAALDEERSSNGHPAPCTCPSRLGCELHGRQPREHAVPCRMCGRRTWNVSARCDGCTDEADQP